MLTRDGRKDTQADIAAERENVAEHIHVSPEEAASGHEETRTTEEVRQGHTGDHMRYILAGSLAAIVIVFAVVYFAFWS
jgi:hypothetical protein